MSPISWVLYYGLKAVQIPHPIYHEYRWDPQGLNYRANSGGSGKVNAGIDSIWSWDKHSEIIYNTTFMFHSKFSEKLYKAWMGFLGAEEVCTLLINGLLPSNRKQWEKDNGFVNSYTTLNYHQAVTMYPVF
jgi:hypothetical protein